MLLSSLFLLIPIPLSLFPEDGGSLHLGLLAATLLPLLGLAYPLLPAFPAGAIKGLETLDPGFPIHSTLNPNSSKGAASTIPLPSKTNMGRCMVDAIFGQDIRDDVSAVVALLEN